MSLLLMLTHLQLFYSKRSQFVYGNEAEVATVSVGRTVSRTTRL